MWAGDPRCKHEYIDLIERYPDDDGGEESDKHIKARDRRNSCLISLSRKMRKIIRICLKQVSSTSKT